MKISSLYGLIVVTAVFASGTLLNADDDSGKNSDELTKQMQKSLVVVEGDEYRGSGFVCKMRGRSFVLTNAHVLVGNNEFELRLLDGTKLPVSGIYGAVGYDLVMLAVADQPHFFEVFENVSDHLTPGDEIMVIGDAMGEGVARRVDGEIKGFGPALVEVDAAFVSGHSGSPILHRESGKVVGIASYSSEYDRDEIAERDKKGLKEIAKETRWFGYRVDNVKNWERIDWNVYRRQAKMLIEIEARSDGFVEFLLTDGEKFAGDEAIGYAVREFDKRLEEIDIREAEVMDRVYRMVEYYFTRLKQVANDDIAAAKKERLYSFIHDGVEEHQDFRKFLIDSIEKGIRDIRNLR